MENLKQIMVVNAEPDDNVFLQLFAKSILIYIFKNVNYIIWIKFYWYFFFTKTH